MSKFACCLAWFSIIALQLGLIAIGFVCFFVRDSDLKEDPTIKDKGLLWGSIIAWTLAGIYCFCFCCCLK
jgi:hypothetical protein